MLFFTVNAVLVARKLEGDQVLINNVFFSLQKDLLCLERELLNNGFTLSYFHRSPSNGASISIKFLSQPFLGVIFSKPRSRPILPSPSPPGSNVVVSSKESRIPMHL